MARSLDDESIACKGQELIFAGNSFERMGATVHVFEARSGGEISEGGGHEYLTRTSQRGDPRSDVDRESGNIVIMVFDFAGVEPRADFDTESPSGLDDR